MKKKRQYHGPTSEQIAEQNLNIATYLVLADPRKRAIALADTKDIVYQPKLSLKQFIKAIWPIIEPTTPFVDGWHIDAICEHLEAVSRGEIKRLVINIPPRTMKSTAVAVAWPAWTWTFKPSIRWLFASYSATLSTRDSVKCRSVMRSSNYQDMIATKWEFAGDQNQKTRFENDRTGVRISTSVGGLGTGEGGDIIVIDDPHNVKDTFSEIKRQSVIDWWDQTMTTRLNDPATGAVVIIMQRIHQKDLAGHLLDGGLYEHLCLPMRYEGENRCRTSLGFVDKRTRHDELLWPDKFSNDHVSSLEKSLGSYGSAGQLQQRPAPLKGGIIQIDWFGRYTNLPHEGEIIRVFQVWDTAQKANELLNAPWVCGTFIETKESLYLADVYREWMDYPTGKRAVVNLYNKWNPVAVVVEDKSTGSSIIQEVNRETKIPVIPFLPEGDKITRLATESPAIEAGKVLLPITAPWLHEYETELAQFPNSATMDQADMTSMALKWARVKSTADLKDTTAIMNMNADFMSTSSWK